MREKIKYGDLFFCRCTLKTTSSLGNQTNLRKMIISRILMIPRSKIKELILSLNFDKLKFPKEKIETSKKALFCEKP